LTEVCDWRAEREHALDANLTLQMDNHYPEEQLQIGNTPQDYTDAGQETNYELD